MTPAETFTLVIAPATILVLALIFLLGFRIAFRRFAVRERHLLDAIEAERDGGNAHSHTPGFKVRTTLKRDPAERRSESGG